MSDSIDNRIVSVQFENASFEDKIAATIKSLDRLSKTLEMTGNVKGLQSLDAAAQHVDFGRMADGVSNISHKLSLMGIIGITTIATLTHGILSFVSSAAKKDFLGPIITGGLTRAKNIEQAKFMFAGLGINIEQGMQSALDAVKGTAFGLDEAAKAAAQFGAAGIKVGGDMTAALRGVAGAAALTGTSFSEMAQIFEGSAGSGVVNNQDLGQFATRGLNAAAAVGKVMGKTEAQIHQMAAAGQLDFKTFAAAMDSAFGKHATEANQTFTGALANMHAALSRLGASFFSPELGEWRNLLNALTPVIDAVNKALLPLTLTINHFVHTGVNAMVKGLNGLKFDTFSKGIGNIVTGLQVGFNKLRIIMAPIKQAFRDVFPASASSVFLKFSEGFKTFIERIKIGGQTLTNIRRIFGGFFAAIHIGFTVLKDVVGFIGNLFKSLAPAGSGLFEFAAHIGDLVKAFDAALSRGKGFDQFIARLGPTVQGIIHFFQNLGESISNFFDKLKSGKLGGFITGIQNAFAKLRVGNLSGITDGIKKFFDLFNNNDSGHFTNSFSGGLGRLQDRLGLFGTALKKVGSVFSWFWTQMFKLRDFVLNAAHALLHGLSNIGPSIQKALNSEELQNFLHVLNTLFAGIAAVGLKNLGKNGLNLNLLFGGKAGGFFDEITKSAKGLTGTFQSFKSNLDTLRGTLKAMQTQIKSKTMLNIAIALGVLTASVVVLSLIDPKALAKAMGAMAAGFTELVGAMTAMDKLGSGVGGAAKVAAMGAGLIALAAAMVILSIAMKIFATMNGSEIAKALIALGGSLAIIAGAMRLMPSGPAMIAQSAGLVAVAGAMILIAGAMKIFATMSLKDIAKGLVSIGGALVIIAGAMHLMPGPEMALTGAGLVAVGAALNLIAAAMKIFATMKLSEIGKGILAIAGSLIAIGIAMNLFPITTPITAAGLIVIGIALGIMAVAIKKMGDLKLGTIVKGIVSFAAMLVILAAAMHLMQGALPGAAALAVISVSMGVLAHVIQTLGGMKTGDIVRGIVALAAALLVFIAAGALAEPVIGGLLGLAVALGVLGISFALFGVGAALVAKSFEVMARSGAAGAKGILAAIKIISQGLPGLVLALAKSLVQGLKAFLAEVPGMITVLGQILDKLLDVIIKEVPKATAALGVLLDSLLTLILNKAPGFIDAGFTILKSFLQGISDNIEEITNTVSDIIKKFFDALTKKAPGIVDSIFNFIVAVMKEVAFKLGEVSATLLLGEGVLFIKGFIKGLNEAMPGVFGFFATIGGKIIGWIGDAAKWLWHKGLDTIVGFLVGVAKGVGKVALFFITLPFKILGWLGDMSTRLITKGVNLIAGFFSGITKRFAGVISWFTHVGSNIVTWIGDTYRLLIDAGKNLIRGLWAGINSVIGWVGDKIKGVVGKIVGFFTGPLHINSPSKVFHEIGQGLMEGLANGIGAMDSDIRRSMEAAAKNVTDSFNPDVDAIGGAIKLVAKRLSDLKEFNPTITPVLDLSVVEQQAKNMKALTIGADASLKAAKVISISQNDSAKNPGGDSSTTNQPRDVIFNQTINSPKSLSTSDIYRGTKSQIALAKEKLKTS